MAFRGAELGDSFRRNLVAGAFGTALGEAGGRLIGAGIKRAKAVGRWLRGAGDAAGSSFGPIQADFEQADALVDGWRIRAMDEGWADARMSLDDTRGQMDFHDFDPNFPERPPDPAPDFPLIDPNRPQNGNQYSVLLEVGVPTGSGNLKLDFAQANRGLYNSLKTDSQLLEAMQHQYPEVVQHVQPGSSGGFLQTSPPGWTWHHRPITKAYPEPGVMQLVSRLHHQHPGAVQQILHPNGLGGFAQWGQP